MTAPTLHTFDDGVALAETLAVFVASALAARIACNGTASLAVSGGRTPIRFFEALSLQPLDWSAVSITLVDERWVGEGSERSNARLVRAHLLQGRARAARFVPLVNDANTPEAGLAAVDAALDVLTWPLACVVLGMGEDGHTASFFSDGDRLASALDPDGTRRLETMRAPGAGEPRITLTLPALLTADRLALHIEGTSKRPVLNAALGDGATTDMPVRAVLRSPRCLEIFWCL
jgi:6-phosphogluconolactonase